jgi:hypothetical protein
MCGETGIYGSGCAYQLDADAVLCGRAGKGDTGKMLNAV